MSNTKTRFKVGQTYKSRDGGYEFKVVAIEGEYLVVWSTRFEYATRRGLDGLVIDKSESHMLDLLIPEPLKHKVYVIVGRHCNAGLLSHSSPHKDSVERIHGRWLESNNYSFISEIMEIEVEEYV